MYSFITSKFHGVFSWSFKDEVEDFIELTKLSNGKKQSKIILHNFIREAQHLDFDMCDLDENYMSFLDSSSPQQTQANNHLGDEEYQNMNDNALLRTSRWTAAASHSLRSSSTRH